ncbi:uncharacterized [Tachysurus ichikawai]
MEDGMQQSRFTAHKKVLRLPKTRNKRETSVSQCSTSSRGHFSGSPDLQISELRRRVTIQDCESLQEKLKPPEVSGEGGTTLVTQCESRCLQIPRKEG